MVNEPRNPGRVEDEGSPLAVVPFLAVVLVGVVAVVGAIRVLTRDSTIPVHHYGGVEWSGDECRVVEELEVIVCRGPIG